MLQWEDIDFAHAIILGMASPLTQHLNIPRRPGRFGMKDSVLAMIDKTWRDVFELDWNVSLKELSLPGPSSLTFRHIKTKQMLERCKDNFKSKYCFTNEYLEDRHGHIAKIKIECVLAGAMENMWLDELTEYLQYPVALAHAAVYGGHVQFLKYLVDTKGVDLSQIQQIASADNSSLIMMAGFGHSPSCLAMDIAARFGHLEMVKYLHAAGSTACSIKAIDDAARSGNLDVVKWLHENRTEGCTSDAAENAIFRSHVDVVKYLHRNGLMHTPCNMGKATNLEMIKYVHEECQAKCSTEAMGRAAIDGRLDIVKYLYQHSMDACMSKVMDIAVKYGHLNVIKYLHENHIEQCTVQTMDKAISNNYLDIVKYLIDKRIVQVSLELLEAATQRGKPAIAQYLQDNLTDPVAMDRKRKLSEISADNEMPCNTIENF